MTQLQQLNPALRISVIDAQVFAWQTSRFMFPIEGPVEKVFEQLERLRMPFYMESLPENLKSLACKLMERGGIVSCAVAREETEDRRVAAWSIINPDALSITRKLQESFVLIVGAGGVASLTAQSLCRLGVGNMMVCDSDRVEESNLSKSFIFSPSDIGKNKATVLREKLQNETTNVHSFEEKILDIESFLNSLDQLPNVVVWGGDENERRTFFEFAKVLRKLLIPITTGGVLEHTVVVGPTLLDADIDKVNISEKIEFLDQTMMVSQFNQKSINPGTAISVGMAASIISNEVLAIATNMFQPALRRRQLLIDLLSMDCTFQPIL